MRGNPDGHIEIIAGNRTKTYFLHILIFNEIGLPERSKLKVGRVQIQVILFESDLYTRTVQTELLRCKIDVLDEYDVAFFVFHDVVTV